MGVPARLTGACPTLRGVMVAMTLGLLAWAPHQAEAERALSWAELPDPAVQSFEDPYLDLTTDQIGQLVDYHSVKRALEDPGLSPERASDLRTRIDDLRAEFAARSLDPDWLIEQRWVVAARREAAATQGNPDWNGAQVTLEGFAIAAPPDADGIPTVYLVELRGLCSHMPPPDANRMIRVRLHADWQPRYMHHPVRLTGKLHLDPSTRSMRVVDGPVDMQAAWRLEASLAEPYFPRPPEELKTSGWAERLQAMHDAASAETGQ